MIMGPMAQFCSKTILAISPHIPFSDIFHKVPTSNQMVFQVGAIVEVLNPIVEVLNPIVEVLNPIVEVLNPQFSTQG